MRRSVRHLSGFGKEHIFVPKRISAGHRVPMLRRRCLSGTPNWRKPWGVVLDIDGVVIQGNKLVPGAKEAARMLRDEGVPFVFMTNGGGVTEEVKSRYLAELLDDASIDGSRILLAHTPMQCLADRYRGRRVVIVGSLDSIFVAESYGFDVDGGWAITPSQIAAGTPGILWCPSHSDTLDTIRLRPIDVNSDDIPIEAILIFHDPNDWFMDLQILSDVLAGGTPLGAGVGEAACKQVVDVFVSNMDFLWRSSYPVSRYGQGAFVECLSALWRRRSGEPLRYEAYGKPCRRQFDAVRDLFRKFLSDREPKEDIERFYMIGDNPAADIRGANGAGPEWRSILVCTGVYQGGVAGNDPVDPAWRVEKDMRVAVERLLSMSDEEHLQAI